MIRTPLTCLAEYHTHPMAAYARTMHPCTHQFQIRCDVPKASTKAIAISPRDGTFLWVWNSALAVSRSLAAVGPHTLLLGTEGVGSNPIPPSPCADCVVQLDISDKAPVVRQLYRGTTNSSRGDIFLTDATMGLDGSVYARDSAQLYKWNTTSRDGSPEWTMHPPRPDPYTKLGYGGSPVVSVNGAALFVVVNDRDLYSGGKGYVTALALTDDGLVNTRAGQNV